MSEHLPPQDPDDGTWSRSASDHGDGEEHLQRLFATAALTIQPSDHLLSKLESLDRTAGAPHVNRGAYRRQRGAWLAAVAAVLVIGGILLWNAGSRGTVVNAPADPLGSATTTGQTQVTPTPTPTPTPASGAIGTPTGPASEVEAQIEARAAELKAGITQCLARSGITEVPERFGSPEPRLVRDLAAQFGQVPPPTPVGDDVIAFEIALFGEGGESGCYREVVPASLNDPDADPDLVSQPLADADTKELEDSIELSTLACVKDQVPPSTYARVGGDQAPPAERMDLMELIVLAEVAETIEPGLFDKLGDATLDEYLQFERPDIAVTAPLIAELQAAERSALNQLAPCRAVQQDLVRGGLPQVLAEIVEGDAGLLESAALYLLSLEWHGRLGL